MGTIRRGGFGFRVYPKDHSPPHAHVVLDRGAIIIAFEHRTVRVIRRLGYVREADESKVLAVALEVYGEVVDEWRKMQR